MVHIKTTGDSAYPITSTALLSSGSSSRAKAMGSHRLSLAMILTPFRPPLSKVYRSSWYSHSHTGRQRAQEDMDDFHFVWLYSICSNHVKLAHLQNELTFSLFFLFFVFFKLWHYINIKRSDIAALPLKKKCNIIYVFDMMAAIYCTV